MRILVATKNRGKFDEISGFFGDELPMDFLGSKDVPDLVEDGDTHKANSEKKAVQASRFFPEYKFVLAEDSGIYVEALANELGINTRRWGGKDDDEEWLRYFLERMEKESLREAKFVCNACLLVKKSEGVFDLRFFEGETFGAIAEKKMAPLLPGLPLSSVFVPDGFDRVYAALSREEKNKISHRGQAVKQVRDFLSQNFNI